MERERVSEAALREMLISETARAYGKDANFIGGKIEFRRRTGAKPNWDANIGIATPRLLAAFGAALTHLQARFDLD